MKINSVVGKLYDEHRFKKRAPAHVDSIMFHRNEVGETAEEIAEWHEANADVTGSPLMPYTFVIRRDGMIEQTAPLNAITPHGRAWNKRAIGVVLVGDFRAKNKKPPTSAQLDAAIWLTRRLFDFYRRPLKIVGHSDQVGASKWGKQHDCPGALLELPLLVAVVRDMQDIVEAV